MNVGSNAYFTSQYLDAAANRNKFLSYYDDEEESIYSNVLRSSSGFESSSSRQSGFIEPEEIVPSSPSLQSKKSDTSLPISHYKMKTTEPPQVPKEVANVANTEKEPDLGVELTPAQLNYIQQRHARARYYPSRNQQRDYFGDGFRNPYVNPYRDIYNEPYSEPYSEPYGEPHVRFQDPYLYERVKSPSKPKEEYYIKQQRRMDTSPFKPKAYTAPTFREVFDDEKKEEKDSKYNPMETVFDKPNKTNNSNGVMKKALTAVLNKENYHEYNYYEHQDSSSEDDIEPEVTPAQIKAPVKKKKNTKKKNYSKLVLAKLRGENKIVSTKVTPKNVIAEDVKEVRMNSDNSSHSQETTKTNDTSKTALTEKSKNPTIKTVVTERSKAPTIKTLLTEKSRASSPKTIGTAKTIQSVNTTNSQPKSTKNSKIVESEKEAQPQWHPAWQYILSWLVYQPPKGLNGTPKSEVKSNQISEKGSTKLKLKSDSLGIITVPKNVRNDGKNPGIVETSKYKYIKAKENTKKKWTATKNTWAMLNEPVSTLFENDNNPRAIRSVYTKNTHPGESNSVLSLPKSSIVEYSDNGDEVYVEVMDGEEDEELYFNPDTNQLERTPPTSMSSMKITSEPSKKLISNVANAIKSIPLMKTIFTPIDTIGSQFPNLQTLVIVLELAIFVWILYELSRLVDALCMMVKTFCSPFLAIGRIMSRVGGK